MAKGLLLHTEVQNDKQITQPAMVEQQTTQAMNTCRVNP